MKVLSGNMESAMLGHHKELTAVAANSQSRDQVRELEIKSPWNLLLE